MSETFLQRLRRAPALLAPGAYDPLSALMVERAGFEAVYLSVAAETFSMVSLAEQRKRATDPTVRDVYQTVLADEMHHARMGWALLDLLLRREGEVATSLRAYLEKEVPFCFERLVDLTFGDPSSIPEPSLSGELRTLAEGHGYIALQDQYALYRSAVADVWVPGFRALGLSVALDA